MPGCYTQAPDLPALEVNIHEAIKVYLKTVEPEEPLPDFIGPLESRGHSLTKLHYPGSWLPGHSKTFIEVNSVRHGIKS